MKHLNGTGLLFPGQGAQYPGMGADWCAASEQARTTYAEADEALGFSLSMASFAEGDDIHRTDLAQPAIFTLGVAILRTLEAQGLDRSKAAVSAGLSLGEYTALWAAGGIDFASGVRLVRLRGEAMQRASEACPSGMLSLMGATPEVAEALAKVGALHGICQVANLNSPGQVVLSGEPAALEAAAAASKEHGVRRARPLTVAGGFHSECMRPAADELALALREVELKAPVVPFLSNVSAQATDDPELIRKQLAEQVCSPVLWERSMRAALALGVNRYLEPGPGEVLAGLMRKIDGEAEVLSVAKPESLETLGSI